MKDHKPILSNFSLFGANVMLPLSLISFFSRRKRLGLETRQFTRVAIASDSGWIETEQNGEKTESLV